MPDYCRHRDGFDLVRWPAANGTIHVRMRCDRCRDVYGSAVPQDDIDVDNLALFESNYRNPPCARCGHPDTELHHYFPQALARKVDENPDDWPAEYLCARHHGKWHDAVTPKLTSRRWEAPQP